MTAGFVQADSTFGINGDGSQDQLVIGISPFGQPDAVTVAAVQRAGGLGILDLGGDGGRARAEVARARLMCPSGFGVRISGFSGVTREAAWLWETPETKGAVRTVVLTGDSGLGPADIPPGTKVLVEATSLEEARRAVASGAHGLIARGSESGGRVGELSTFVLLIQILDDVEVGGRVPVWACGGIGANIAGGVVLAGGAGVVLDCQLALVSGMSLPDAVMSALDRGDSPAIENRGGINLLKNHDGEPFPVGPDAFLAKAMHDKYRTTARLVREVRETVINALTQDFPTAAALRPNSPSARALGVEMPVVQGPMTRVSDRPGFAGAVAAAGGLPLLALALSDAERCRVLLAETSRTLGDRPWGVGLLGFVPEELKAAQMAVVQEAKPAFALIAGGRPAQASALEAEGISTFLHVPSPVLLRQFLRSGARKFVFEGSECGGHIGPSSSFPLWESQISVLLEHLDGADQVPGDGLVVLFAGGIHSSRSSALVVGAARKLLSRSVAVGQLMGTAYLFTHQAVEHGAITPRFQQQVLEATRTAVLESAPGHATRCVQSPFVDQFVNTRRRLSAQGVPERGIWEELEGLNVGRLRLAAKGIRREGAALVEVDDEQQRTDGLFMAGQVAAVRTSAGSVRELHEAVTSQAADLLDAVADQARERLGLTLTAPADSEPQPLEIAIVGLAGALPQVADVHRFWAAVLEGTDLVTDVPQSRWDKEIFATAAGDGRGTSASTRGGFLPPIPFDPLRYGIPPNTLKAIEPAQLLALDVARRALEDAGFENGGLDRERTSVVFGAEAGSDLSGALGMRTLYPAYSGRLPEVLDQELPVLTEDSFPGTLPNVIAGRIANRLDLGGSNFVVDAACASSLAALDVACRLLTSGQSDTVLCGGVDTHNGINDYVMFSAVGALSAQGRSRPFDASADGIVLGEAAACVVLKRRADAERDGDRIYAVVQAVNGSSDGRAQGLTAPRREGQQLALERAYWASGLDPARVGLVEAHGTGTVAGDRAELAALTDVFSRAGAPAGSIVLGSVKSQIGHTKCAAGMVGLIKAALAVYGGVRPPTLLDRPQPAWEAARSPFSFRSSSQPWPQAATERIAGVSSFGFGGTNFHAVIQGHESSSELRHGRPEWPSELFVFAGRSQQIALSEVRRFLDLLDRNEQAGSPWPLRDLAATASRVANSRPDPIRIALVSEDLPMLREQLTALLESAPNPPGVFQADADPEPGKVAFVFPGQGSQRPEMLAELLIAFPQTQRFLRMDPEIAAKVFPERAFDEDQVSRQKGQVTDTRVAQPALGIAGLAVHDLLAQAGVHPEMVAGHSYGELAALSVAGVLAPETLLELSRGRAESIFAALGPDPGAMAAVSASPREVEETLAGTPLAEQIVLANHNAPRQVVISGPTAAVDAAVGRLRGTGLNVTALRVACAFHSPLVAGSVPRFAALLADLPVYPPQIPVWSNRTAQPYPQEPDQVRRELAEQLASPVAFVDEIEAMYAAGARTFVECGPGSVLSGLVRRVLEGRPHSVVPVEPSGRTGLGGFLSALAVLAVAGVPVRTRWLFEGRAAPVDRSAVPARPGWTVDGHLVRTGSGEPLERGLRPSRPVLEENVSAPVSDDQWIPSPAPQPMSPPALSPVATVAPASPPVTSPLPSVAPSPGRDAVVTSFLNSHGQIVAAQRDVLLAYLGSAVPEAPAQTTTVAPANTDDLWAQGPSDWGFSPAMDSPAAGPDLPALETSWTPASPQAPTPAQVPVPVPAPARAVPVADLVRETISERTGYPPDMVEPTLDLESDLGIDSIKRLEIAADLLDRSGVDVASRDSGIEELSRLRSTAQIIDWLEEASGSRSGGPSPDPAPRAADPKRPEAPSSLSIQSSVPTPARRGEPPARFVVTAVPTASPDGVDLPQLMTERVLVVGDPAGLGEHVLKELIAAGAQAEMRPSGHLMVAEDEPVSGVVVLTGPGPDPALPAAFPIIKSALQLAPAWLTVVAEATKVGCDEPLQRSAAGLRGLLRTVNLEYPDTAAKLLEVDSTQAISDVAALVVDELPRADHAPVVQREVGSRYRLELTPAPLGLLDSTGAGPADGASTALAAAGLGPDSVVMLFGGARGVTSRAAAVLAEARGWIELVGSTPEPIGPEDPETAGAKDIFALRRLLASLRSGSISELNAQARLILAQRQIRATLAELTDLGTQVRYHQVDARDRDAVALLTRRIHAEHGRLDGMVYGSGINDDALIQDLSPERFEAVFAVKVDGAQAALDACAELPEPPSFAVLFGSVAAVQGNSGQANYAAANDVLDTLAVDWSVRTGSRAVTMHWGPWSPEGEHPGMVSPDLEKALLDKGLKLIDPAEGGRCVLREVAWGNPETHSVLYTPAGWVTA